MMDAAHKAPVVVFTYRKTNALKHVLDAVNEYHPERLYIVTDLATDEDQRDVAAVKSLLDGFDFKVKPEFIIPPAHQGILYVFEYALGLIFKHEQQLIILEDDTVPSPLFFTFCNRMLANFETDKSIGCINGANLEASHDPSAFFLSKIALPFWGWATWADRWQAMPRHWDFWEPFRVSGNGDLTNDAGQIMQVFDYVSCYPKSWDTKWAMFLLAAAKQIVFPGVNLVCNMGYTDKATFANIPGSRFAGQAYFNQPYSSNMFIQRIEAENEYIRKSLECILEFRTRIR